MSWVVRTNRDNPARGGGFQEDPEYTSEATGTERQVLSRCSRGFTQLSVDMATTPRALRSVTFTYDRGTGRWGVVVVGSGGEYGSAGTIQVVLAPGELPLVEVAAQVLGWLEHGPLLSPARLGAPASGPLARGGPRVDARALARTLATLLSMDERARHTLLDVPGAQDEQALVMLMGMVPEDLAQMIQWSTAYPRPDRNPGNKVVTCLWAAELADRHPREHDAAMGSTRLVAPSVPPSKVSRNLLWYADLVCGTRPGTDSVRQRADSLFQAQLEDLAPGAAEWEQAVRTWQTVLEQLRPLGNDELLVVLDDAEVPRQVSGRWNDAAAARLIRLRRDRLRDLLTHPHDTVRASAWRVVAAEKALYPDLVAWQADLVEAGQAAPPEAAALVRERSDRSLVVDVLAEVTARQGPSPSWRPRAVAWIESLGLDPRSYEGELPQGQEQVLNRLRQDPTRVDAVVAYVRSAPDGADTLVKAVSQVPQSLGPLLCQLWQAPTAGVTWQNLLQVALPAHASPAQVLKVLTQVNDPAGPVPGAQARQGRGQDGGEPVPAELRRAVVDQLLDGWPAARTQEVALALLAFERALPLPAARPTVPAPRSQAPTGSPGLDQDGRPALTSQPGPTTVGDPPREHRRRQGTQPGTWLAVSGILNIVLLVVVAVLWLG